MIPRVSVIIPTFNRGKYIADALDSVLGQTYRDYEIIVIDDGSSDETPEVLKKFDGKIKTIRQENQGISRTRNRALTESRGEYIAFLDSDDIWTEKKLEEQVKVLDSDQKIGIVYSRMPIINDKGEQLGLKPSGISGRNFKELLEVWGDLPTSTVMARRSCFEKAGQFDTSLDSMEDIDMWIRIARHYDLYEIKDKVLAFYRRHEKQRTMNREVVFEGLVRIYTKILEAYPEAPRSLMQKRIAENTYLLAKENYLKGRWRKTCRLVVQAIKRQPWLGLLFAKKSDNIFQKAVKLVKPYGLLTISFLKGIFSKE